MRKFRSFTSNNGGFSGDLPTAAGCFTSCFPSDGKFTGNSAWSSMVFMGTDPAFSDFLAEIHGENRTYGEVITMSLRPRYYIIQLSSLHWIVLMITDYRVNSLSPTPAYSIMRFYIFVSNRPNDVTLKQRMSLLHHNPFSKDDRIRWSRWFQSLWKIWKSVGMIIPNIWKNVPNHQLVFFLWGEGTALEWWSPHFLLLSVPARFNGAVLLGK